MDTYTIKTPAKLNLRLKVTGKNDAGYHLLSMFNVPISLFDTLTLEISPGNGIELHCSGISTKVDLTENIVYHTTERFLRNNNLKSSVRINLHKEIPVGAGLGGGSSDSAATLRVLSDHFQIPLDEKLARELGADVPYFLNPVPSWVWGIGEKRRAVELNASNLHIILCLPSQPLSTKEVFGQFSQLSPFSNSEDFLYEEKKMDSDKLLSLTENDLAQAAGSLYPELSNIMEEARNLTGQVVSLSGSGSAFFCLISRANEKEYLLKLSALMNKYGGIALPVSIMYPSGATGR